jgi:hypothetical protein
VALGPEEIYCAVEEEWPLEALVVKRDAEEEFALGELELTRAAKDDRDEELGLGALELRRAAEADAEEEWTLGASRKRAAVDELAVKNSAPSSVPRRHFTRMGRPVPYFDSIRINVLGRL